MDRPLRLLVGNFTTSPRSLAVWSVLVRAELPFELERFDLYAEGAAERVPEVAPHGRLPLLRLDGAVLDEPLAMVEFLAEVHPPLWPQHPLRRARARALAADLLYGFPDLEALLPFDLLGRFSRPERLTRLQERELVRLRGRLAEELEETEDGPRLLGGAVVAEAFALPWAVRHRTYELFADEPVDVALRALLMRPELARWEDLARAEQEGKPPAEAAAAAPAVPARPSPQAPAPLAEAEAEASPPSPPPVPVRRRRLFRRRVALPKDGEPRPATDQAPAEEPPAPAPPAATRTPVVKPFDPAAARRRRSG